MFGSDRNRINCSVLSVGMIMVMTIGLYSIFYSILLHCFILLFSLLTHSCYFVVLFYSIILYCFILLFSILTHFLCYFVVLFYSVLFYSVSLFILWVFFYLALCCSIQFNAVCVCVCVCVCVRARAPASW